MRKRKLKPHFGKLSIILIAVAVALVAADLLTKFFEEEYGWNAVIIPNFIKIEYGHRNPGCAFSFLNANPQVGQPILITFTFILLAALVFLFICMPQRFYVLRVAITIIIAGAIGNLVDRLMFNEVRDWFGLWMFGKITYCNLADFWITLGVAVVILDLLFFNEYAVFPLTKKARAAQKARRQKEDEAESLKKVEVSTDGAAAEVTNKQPTTENAANEVQPEKEPENGEKVE